MLRKRPKEAKHAEERNRDSVCHGSTTAAPTQADAHSTEPSHLLHSIGPALHALSDLRPIKWCPLRFLCSDKCTITQYAATSILISCLAITDLRSCKPTTRRGNSNGTVVDSANASKEDHTITMPKHSKPTSKACLSEDQKSSKKRKYCTIIINVQSER